MVVEGPYGSQKLETWSWMRDS